MNGALLDSPYGRDQRQAHYAIYSHYLYIKYIFSSVQMASVFQLRLQAKGHLCTCHMQCLSTLLATPPQPTGHCHMPRAAPGKGYYEQQDGHWQHAALLVNSTQGVQGQRDQW